MWLLVNASLLRRCDEGQQISWTSCTSTVLPATRSVPLIEVTFDIDAHWIYVSSVESEHHSGQSVLIQEFKDERTITDYINLLGKLHLVPAATREVPQIEVTIVIDSCVPERVDSRQVHWQVESVHKGLDVLIHVFKVERAPTEDYLLHKFHFAGCPPWSCGDLQLKSPLITVHQCGGCLKNFPHFQM